MIELRQIEFALLGNVPLKKPRACPYRYNASRKECKDELGTNEA
jgi:hypothetical protein